jgi:hypothetical protein
MLGSIILVVILFLVFQLYWNGLTQRIPRTDIDERHPEEKNVPTLR